MARPSSPSRGESEPDLFQLLGARWDKLWYVSPRRTAQEARAVLLAAARARGGLPLPEGARVLDIGCGTGRHALRLAKAGLSVTGVDLAPSMVRAATAKARAAGFSGRARFVVGDATRLPVKAGRFDLAVSLCEGAFGAHPQPVGDRRLLREARRALRPGGTLILVALSRPWLDRQGEWRYDPARGRSIGREWHTYEDGRRRKVEISTRAYEPGEAIALLERCGLRVELALGAAPGEYGERPLDDSAMQYMIAARRPERAARGPGPRAKPGAKRGPMQPKRILTTKRKVNHAPRSR